MELKPLTQNLTLTDQLNQAPDPTLFDESKPDNFDEIGIGLQLYSVDDICIRSGTFSARIRLVLKWRTEETSKAKPSERTYLDPTDRQYKIPRYTCNMGSGSTNITEFYQDETTGLLTMVSSLEGTWKMRDSSCYRFPFDRQGLDFKFTMDEENFGRTFVQIEKPDQLLSYKNPCKNDVIINEFYMFPPKVAVLIDHDRNLSSVYVCRPVMVRKAEYFYSHVLSKLNIISSLGFLAYVIPAHDFVSRAGIILTLILTIVAFTFVVNESLPRVSYLTRMDKFLRSYFRLLSLMMLTMGVAALLERIGPYTVSLFNRDIAASLILDVGSMIVILVCWVYYQASIYFEISTFKEKTFAQYGEPLSK